MFGFSLQKLLVLILVIAAVWYGFKYLSRLDAKRKTESKLRERGGGTAARGGSATPAATETDAEDMVQCPTCRAYVAARGAANCGRADCPY